ncbi:hypothetical protein C3486_28405 [Streptomyces sp. Ru73]|nr:hypothetical protein C3486_28405 [Streptomyces sp. Ru73]
MADCLRKVAAGGLPLRECAEALGLDGLALLLASDTGLPEPLHLHGPLARPLEDLQLVHGEGPGWDAAQRGTTLFVPDLSAPAVTRWPGLTPAVQDLGVRAVFAFPMRIATVRIGALLGHRRAPGLMTPRQLRDARAFAGAAAHATLQRNGWLTDRAGLPFAAVHEATGALVERLGVSPEYALLRLRSHAFRHDRSLLDTARAVLGGGLDDV